MKPSIPKGTRDFSPKEVIRRDYIFDTVRQVFRLYGYQPIETPAMENLSTLLGKYGEDGDKLIYRILNSGDFLSGVSDRELLGRETAKLSAVICERGLRYDLTVPFARYVVQNRDKIIFPFRRYQIQPVWRADRPQKGRYREFSQCDVDIIGSNSLLNEYELVRIIDDVFKRLKISIEIRINNRKILSGIAEIIGESAKITDITVTIDKLEKVGPDAVNQELKDRGVSDAAIKKLQPVINLKGTTGEKLARLKGIIAGSETGIQGVSEMKTLFSFIESSPSADIAGLDLTLARGLDYYTGAIIEVRSKDVRIGSICGGGRYDNLTGVFGLEGISGVGVSFGADRIYDVLDQTNLFDDIKGSGTQVLILNFGEKEVMYGIGIQNKLKEIRVSSEVYPDPVKLKKQMSYADARKIPYIIIAGDEEIKSNVLTLKIMSSGEQKKMSPDELISFFKSFHF
ncbi:MAG: histidine--tRNA ligase [Bacteroidota bacterium]|nr:histidine--tRNA ligase [Bacteroidota bacterium]